MPEYDQYNMAINGYKMNQKDKVVTHASKQLPVQKQIESLIDQSRIRSLSEVGTTGNLNKTSSNPNPADIKVVLKD